jgi:hypothetical protein
MNDITEAHLPCVEGVTRPSFWAASAFSALFLLVFFIFLLQFPLLMRLFNQKGGQNQITHLH